MIAILTDIEFPKNLKKMDNNSLAKIIDEIRAELDFIKGELHINTAGPCQRCNRRWFVSQSNRAMYRECDICNIKLCPTCINGKCNSCKKRCCDEHYHKCLNCDGYCSQCLLNCDQCGTFCPELNKCTYSFDNDDNEWCHSCPVCDPVMPVDIYGGIVHSYCSKHTNVDIDAKN